MACQEYQAPYFAGGATLCDQNANFVPDYVISNGSLASNLNLTLWPVGSTAFSNKKILVQGIFYLNIPVAFNNCLVKLAPGAQIIVGTTGIGIPTLTEILSLRTKYFSCETMWKGIVIKNGNRARFYWSTFEDAQYALTIGNRVSIALFGNLFNRNFVAIRNDESTTTMPILLFKKNVFDCTSALHAFYDLDFPGSGDIDPVSFSGILLQECAINLGYYSAGNRFKNMVYGIAATDATINVKGCKFSDGQVGVVIPHVIEDNPSSTSGIRTIGGELFVIGTEESGQCEFLSNAGVQCSGSDCFISYTNFENASITCENNFAGQTIYIEHNKFFADSGSSTINVERSMASGDETHTYIASNIMVHENQQIPGRLIFVGGTNDATDYAEVFNNDLFFDAPNMVGISASLFRSNNLHIDNNIIEFNGNECSAGISLWLGITEGTEVFGDSVSGTLYDAFATSTAIKASNVRGAKYCGNIVSDLAYGLGFYGNCDNSHITQNFLGIQDETTLGIGLYVHNGGQPGVIGVQRGTRNYFLSPGSQYGEDLAASFASTAPLLSSAYLISDGDQSMPTLNPNSTFVDPSSGWFKVQGSENDLCNEGSLLKISYYDSLTINSDSTYEVLSEPVKFYTEKNLLAILLSNQDWIDLYEDYLNVKIGTPEYTLAKIENALKKAYRIDLSTQDELDSLLYLQRSELGRLVTYDAYNYANIDSSSFSFGVGQDSITAILERLHAWAEQRIEIRGFWMADLASALAQIQDSLDAFIPEAVYEEYYKIIFSMRIKQITNGFLDSADYELLVEIANDETDSSFANITAFSLFDLCGDFLMPEFMANGISENANIDQISNPIPPGNENVQSPSTEYDFESLTLGQGEDFYLYDLSGRCVLRSKGSTLNLIKDHLSSVSSGLYYWILLDRTGQLSSSGLIPLLR